MTNVYLIVSDLHKYYRTKMSRIDYVKEIDFVEDRIIKVASKYAIKGDNVSIIFLGDIFDSSYREVKGALGAHSFFTKLNSIAELYSVVGNHELTYYKNNPFWFMIKSFNSEKLSTKNSRYRLVQADKNLINITDRLVDGNVEFIFNHYGTGVALPDTTKTSIGLFHQDIVFREILDEAKRNNLSMFELDQDYMEKKFNYVYLKSDTGMLSGYSHCFFGHQHKLYGEWNYDGIMLHYLASLGRTNVTEVQDNFLERDIPAVIVKDGNLEKVESNKFNLMSREECVDEVLVSKNRKKYEKTKALKDIMKSMPVAKDPIEGLKQFFNNPVIDIVVEDCINSRADSILSSILEKFGR